MSLLAALATALVPGMLPAQNPRPPVPDTADFAGDGRPAVHVPGPDTPKLLQVSLALPV